MFKTVIATALIATIAAPAPASAKGHIWQVGNDAMHVYYSDIDVNSATGRAQLLARIQRAAARLCQDRVDQRGCVDALVHDAAGLPGTANLRLALAERDGIRVATR